MNASKLISLYTAGTAMPPSCAEPFFEAENNSFGAKNNFSEAENNFSKGKKNSSGALKYFVAITTFYID
jgi:hypothetical protein